MSDKYNELRKFHYNNDYFVKLKRNKNKDGCIVFFPKNLLSVRESSIYSYFINDTELSVTNENTQVNKRFEFPKCVMKSVIVQDIFFKCAKFDLNQHLVFCIDENENFLKKDGTGLLQAIRHDVSDEERVRQKAFYGVHKAVLLNSQAKELAKQLGLEKEYDTFVAFVDEGGFNL